MFLLEQSKPMNIFLAWRPSLKLWIAPPESHIGSIYHWPPQKSRAIPSPTDIPAASSFEALPAKLKHTDGKADIVVPSTESRSQSSLVRNHIWMPPDSGAFAKIASNIFISTPESCFAQYAQELKVAQLGEIKATIDLAQLAYMLCGTYRIQADSICQFGIPPLTNASRLIRFMEKVPHKRGRRIALQSLKYVKDNSGSPMETKLAIAFSLPYRLGGFSMPPSELNREIVVESNGRTPQRTYRNDLFWNAKAGVALEYNGLEYHTGERATVNDTNRQLDILANGVKIIYATKAQTASPQALVKLAESVSRELGKRCRCRRSDLDQLHYELWKGLFRSGNREPW